MISEIQSIHELIKKEGDQKEWVYTCRNGIEFKCYIRRQPRAGHLCGYIHLTPDSDFYGYEYDDIPVDCHGGLTYGSEHDTEWVIGFDCGHLNDLQPFYTDMEYYGKTGTYRDMEFVKKECESICEQISTKSKSHKRISRLNILI